MKASEIKVGCYYTAKVNGKIVTVRVDAVESHAIEIRPGHYDVTRYEVTNLATGRKTRFRSAAKFRG